MKNQVQSYLNEVTKYVGYKEAHLTLKTELESHINDTAADLVQLGKVEESALEEAIERMGPADDTGRKLDRIHRPFWDVQLLGGLVAMLILGIFSMSMVSMASLQSIWMCVGSIALVGAIFIKPKYIRSYAFHIYFGSLSLLVCSLIFGTLHQGQPYIALGLLNINVAALSVVFFVISLAGVFDRFKSKKQVLIGMALGYVPFAILLYAGAIYPALLFLVAAIAMIATFSVYREKATIFAAAISLSFFFGGSASFVLAESFGNLISTEKHTDFIFQYLYDQNSILALGILLTYSFIATRLIVLVSEIKNSFTKSLCVGGAAVFLVGTSWGLLANMGFMPIPSAGLNLPLLSYGGSFVLGYMLIFGFILGAYRRKSLTILA